MNKQNFWEIEVYAKNLQWNLHPFTELLSQFSRVSESYSKKGNVLEVGCGVGNNLLALAQLDYYCFGVDISKTAIKEAKRRSNALNLNTDFIVGNIESMTLPSEFFHYILDRSTLTVLPFSSVNVIVDKIYHALKRDSYFLGFDWIGKNTDDLNFGISRDGNTFTKFKKGKYKSNDFITAFNYDEIKKIFKKFSQLEINTITSINDKNHSKFETFSIIAKK